MNARFLALPPLAATAMVLGLAPSIAGAQNYRITSSEFNPAISVILDGRYNDYANDPDDYELPGFQLGGEAELDDEGFTLGEIELAASANVDDLFYGKFTLVVADEDGGTETELEEAYVETIGLGGGVTVRGGRFFSAIGYLNEFHPHAWDFADAPLIYRGLFGDQYFDDGVQLRWVAPTELFIELGGELMRGDKFPATGAENDGVGVGTVFATLGGDVGLSHSWQAGLAYWQADVSERDDTEGNFAFTGDSDIVGLDLVWKWAPNGNPRQRNFKLQFEYFWRDEDGDIDDTAGTLTSDYDGTQSGWYAQSVYQFRPRWRVALRYDRLDSDNDGSDATVLAAAGLDDDGQTPQRASVMVDYNHSEFGRLRAQYNRDESYADADDQFTLQYVMSLGAHGAHRF